VKKVGIEFLLLVTFVIVFVFSGCTFFQPQQQPTSSLPSEELEAIKNQLYAIEYRLAQMESQVINLSDKIYQTSMNYSYDNEMVKSLKDQYTYVEKRIVTLENYLYEGRSYEDIDRLLDLDVRVKKLEDASNLSIFYTSDNYDSSGIEARILKLENQINELENLLVNIPKMDQKLVLDNINELNEKVNYLEKSFKNSDFYFLQNGNVKELIENEIKEADLEGFVESIVDYKTEEAVSKLYYQNQSENILKVKLLEDKVMNLENQISGLNNELQKALIQPPNSLNEVYIGQIQDLNSKINDLYYNLGEKEVTQLLGSSSEIKYVVKSGDTLISISNAFNLGNKGVQIIMQANNLQSTNIRVGQELKIPVGNVEELIRWPFEKTKPSDYDRIVIRFGERNVNGVSSGIGVLVQDEQIYSILPGRVIESGKLTNNNYYLKIDHGNGIVTVTSNLKTLYVSQNSWVDITKSLGNGKNGDIVNIELWKNGEPKDPLRLFYKKIGDFKATYYTEWDDKIVYSPTFRLTRSGDKPISYQTIAADPKVLPLGTVVYIPELSTLPNNGYFIVQDTGSQIVGNKIDIYVNDVRLANKTEEKITVYVVSYSS